MELWVMKEFNININFLFCLNKNHSYLKFINNFTLSIFLEVFLFGWSMFQVSASEQTMDHLRWDNSYCNIFKNINKFREKIYVFIWCYYFTFLVTCFLTLCLCLVKFQMQRFTTKIVNIMKAERLYESQGGPIILSQVN
jgi:hypothetical protein